MSTSTEREARDEKYTQELLSFLETRTKVSWDAERDLFRTGGLSSLFAMELVMYLEKTFGIRIAGPDLRLDNFRTVNAMVELVNRLREPAPGESVD
jgi:methoxymalonate biosynthesis acyl carrier protein